MLFVVVVVYQQDYSLTDYGDHDDHVRSSLLRASSRQILQHGARSRRVDMYLFDSDHRNALMLASVNNHSAVCTILAQQGVPIGVVDKDNKNALQLAKSDELKSGLGAVCMLRAAASGDLETVKLLVNQNVNINVMDKSERTPVMYARGGHFEVIKFLCENDCIMASQYNDGWTTLM